MEKLLKQNDNFEDFIDLSFLVDVGKAIVSARSMKEILNRVMEKVGSIFAPLNWSLILLDPQANELVFKLVVGEAADKLRGKRIPADEGISGWIAETGQSVIVTDVLKDKRFSKRIDKMTGFSTQSIIGVPLKTENRVLGMIELVNKLNGQPFTALELKALTIIADFAAIALEKAFYIRAMRRISMTDHLTGVLNRRSLDRLLSLEVEKCKRYSNTLSALMIDINDFKQINDSYGHPVGDEVLKDCAEVIAENVRKVDQVARYGGDEFVVIMPSTDKQSAERVKDRILEDIRKRTNGDLPPYSVSIGVHSCDGTGECDLLEQSDKALYEQKIKKENISMGDQFFSYLDDEEREESGSN